MKAQHKTVALAVVATLAVIWAIKNVDALEAANEMIFDD